MPVISTNPERNTRTFSSPTILTRIQSIFLDNIILFGVLIILFTLASNTTEIPTWIRVAAAGAALLYEPVLVAFRSTLGQKVSRIRVVDYTAYQQGNIAPIGFIRSLKRYVVKWLLGWVSLLSISFSKDRRAIHDFASGSIMIEV